MDEDIAIGSAFSAPSSSICGFRYRPTAGYVKHVYRNGNWNEKGEFVCGSSITVSVMCNALHYGQALFEGLKVFSTKPQNGNSDVCVFCDEMNYRRMKDGAMRLGMEMVTPEIWTAAIDRCVVENKAYLPTYYGNNRKSQEGELEGSGCGVVDGCSLYLRPMLFGSGDLLTPVPSNEFTFLVMCMPVSTQYYPAKQQQQTTVQTNSTANTTIKTTTTTDSSNGSGGIAAVGGAAVELNSVDCLVLDEYDRAAPRGVGFVKAAGNYATDIYPATLAKKNGYPICLYLDPIHKQFVEEFNTSNFVGIMRRDKQNGESNIQESTDNKSSEYVYVTPSGECWGGTVLPSITNKCLQTLASNELGMDVEKRKINFQDEIDLFEQVGAVGTAVVVTKIKSFTRGEKKWLVGGSSSSSGRSEPVVVVGQKETPKDSGGGLLEQLYDLYTKIQKGESEDKYRWMRKIDMHNKYG
eukprot:GHVS01073460.1.p1 GENE.GHVS01073460.1~~GHVS01073460.1.p1  ORF type:complete len:466 (-),score=115.79 GHVS01073460.1:482-1879(-)